MAASRDRFLERNSALVIRECTQWRSGQRPTTVKRASIPCSSRRFSASTAMSPPLRAQSRPTKSRFTRLIGGGAGQVSGRCLKFTPNGKASGRNPGRPRSPRSPSNPVHQAGRAMRSENFQSDPRQARQRPGREEGGARKGAPVMGLCGLRNPSVRRDERMAATFTVSSFVAHPRPHLRAPCLIKV